tara:strand:- start:1348 stop:1755 length:408 start_codon:yes stop_codon:yes gene_type:complete
MTELILSAKKELNSRIKEVGSLGLAIVYTIGHIIIAWACATLIFNASFSLAAADAIIEPIINGFWFYLLHRIAKNSLGTLSLTSIYTLGHFCIATLWASFIFNVSFSDAAVDAIIEPILNGFWFYFLHSLWKKNN